MNILILNWRDPKNPKSGGAEIVTLEHAIAWVKNGHSVVWFSSDFQNALSTEYIKGVKIVRRGSYLSVFIYAPLYYFFSGIKFDLVIDEIHGIPFFTPFYVRKPIIAFIHEVADEIWDYMYSFPVNKIGKLIEMLTFIFYKKVKFMTASDSTRIILQKLGIPKKNIMVIESGLKDKPIDVKIKKENIPTFIFVSRVVKMKGIEDVIRAYFYILKSIKNANLWIVGDGDDKYVRSLKKTIASYSISSKIQFFGHVSNAKKIELMQKAHILLHASVKEGWGLVVVEAAAQGTPAVVYNVAGLRDSVVNGKTGVVISKNTPDEMANQAIKLLNDKEKYSLYRDNGIRRGSELNWDKSVSLSLHLINQVIKNYG